MFENEIQKISDYYRSKIKDLGQYFTYEQLLSVDLHPAVLHYISAEIDYLIYEDRKKLLKNSAFDYSGEKISYYFSQIANEIKKSKRFSADFISKLIFHATTFNTHFVARPDWTLIKFIFPEGENKTPGEIKQLLKYVYFYPYLPRVIQSYFSKKKLLSVSVHEFESLLRKIDEITVQEDAAKLLVQAISSIAAFFNFTETEEPEFPVKAVKLFAKEKNLNYYYDLIVRAFPDDTVSVTKSKILETLQIIEKEETAEGKISPPPVNKPQIKTDDTTETEKEKSSPEIDKDTSEIFVTTEEESREKELNEDISEPGQGNKTLVGTKDTSLKEENMEKTEKEQFFKETPKEISSNEEETIENQTEPGGVTESETPKVETAIEEVPQDISEAKNEEAGPIASQEEKLITTVQETKETEEQTPLEAEEQFESAEEESSEFEKEEPTEEILSESEPPSFEEQPSLFDQTGEAESVIEEETEPAEAEEVLPQNELTETKEKSEMDKAPSETEDKPQPELAEKTEAEITEEVNTENIPENETTISETQAESENVETLPNAEETEQPDVFGIENTDVETFEGKNETDSEATTEETETEESTAQTEPASVEEISEEKTEPLQENIEEEIPQEDVQAEKETEENFNDTPDESSEQMEESVPNYELEILDEDDEFEILAEESLEEDKSQKEESTAKETEEGQTDSVEKELPEMPKEEINEIKDETLESKPAQEESEILSSQNKTEETHVESSQSDADDGKAPQNKDESQAKENKIKGLDAAKLLENKNTARIIESVFDYDMEDFTNAIVQLAGAADEKEAFEKLDKIFDDYNVNPDSKEGMIFKEIISDYFNKV